MKKKLIKLALIATIILPILFTSCNKGGEGDDIDNTDYSIAEVQLLLDYSNYSITNISWKSIMGYQVASFKLATKSISSANAWYLVTNDSATREKSSESIGVNVPEIIKEAFGLTVYAKADIWKIEDIELETNYNGNAVNNVYEMDLEAVKNANLEAELYFDAKTGKLLYSRESIEENEDGEENDSIVIDDKLAKAVKDLYPNAVIIDAEINDNMIEVEISAIENTMVKEIELTFSMDYIFQSKESEYWLTYGQLPADFSAIEEWFADPKNKMTAPDKATVIDIEEGNLEEDGTAYQYGIEIETTAYEIKFLLNAEYQIVSVEIDLEEDND